MLDHGVCPVTGDNDVVKNENPDPVQQPLKCDGGGDILRRRGAGAAGVVVAQKNAVRVVVEGGFHDQPGIGADL